MVGYNDSAFDGTLVYAASLSGRQKGQQAVSPLAQNLGPLACRTPSSITPQRPASSLATRPAKSTPPHPAGADRRPPLRAIPANQHRHPHQRRPMKPGATTKPVASKACFAAAVNRPRAAIQPCVTATSANRAASGKTKPAAGSGSGRRQRRRAQITSPC
jgi:hypothetical protein